MGKKIGSITSYIADLDIFAKRIENTQMKILLMKMTTKTNLLN
ncbi:hypothetical protein SAMN06265349_1011031 [Flavobacterium resistens]|uniref:Uncharacterized protein n=1 Tax=Flavobacterium resistens TaxID=443612 RepID=A0A521BHB6_9FLAO|nr:hypothetical protein [Flavobacterium resistens]SMO46110.1 hypothetical protein SAMN06265349_1011031 [Flavobacterium resistens]